MSVKYTNFKTFKRGIKREDGHGRLCMHCGRDATVSAINNGGGMKLDVFLCSDHETVARSINAS